MSGRDEDNEMETVTRTTRSGRKVKTAVTPTKTSTRKTRKKMVMIEVEVSEDEEQQIKPASNDDACIKDKDNDKDRDNEDNVNKMDDKDEEDDDLNNSNASNGHNNENVAVEAEIVDDNEEQEEDVQAEVEGGDEEMREINKLIIEKDNFEEKIETEDVSSEEGFADNQNDVDKDDKMDVDIKESSKMIATDPDAENISEDELPGVPVVKVPETEEVSDDELPGPKRAELPADTEVVSEDELPTVKKESSKRKLKEGDYDPCSPTSETDAPAAKKLQLEDDIDKEKEEKKAKKLPELDKYWKAVNDDPTDFTGWTYLLQYVDQENDMEAAREAYDAFLSHYPYCYGYWRKYADYEKRKGNKKKCEEVFERGLKAIPLSVDLWIHYLTYAKTTRADDEEFIRLQFNRAIEACGLEFRSDRLWDSFIKWETEGKRLQQVTCIYDKLLATPTQGYTTHFDNFQEHVTNNHPSKVLELDEFVALKKEVKNMMKSDSPPPSSTGDNDNEDEDKDIISEEDTKAIRERIISIRRKIHKATVAAVTQRWNFEEGIKRPYFHVKPLERCQLKNWQEYLDFEINQGDQTRIITLFERCLIACALYEEFWLRFVHYLEGLKDEKMTQKIKDVYERACTIHHLKKPVLHLQWAMFEESIKNYNKAAEILTNLEKTLPNILQVAYRRINLERRRLDYDKCSTMYEHYINTSKNKSVSSNLSIKYARFVFKIMNNIDKALEIINNAISKDASNHRLHLQLIDLTMQKEGEVNIEEVLKIINAYLEKENVDIEQKVLFAQRKLEFLEDFGMDVHGVQQAYNEYQNYCKLNKESGSGGKKKDKDSLSKSGGSTGKDKNSSVISSSQAQNSSSGSYYGGYGSSSASNAATNYQYSGSQGQYNYSQYGSGQGNDQYNYQSWQYPQGSYGNYNQWSGYGSGYSY